MAGIPFRPLPEIIYHARPKSNELEKMKGKWANDNMCVARFPQRFQAGFTGQLYYLKRRLIGGGGGLQRGFRSKCVATK